MRKENSCQLDWLPTSCVKDSFQLHSSSSSVQSNLLPWRPAFHLCWVDNISGCEPGLQLLGRMDKHNFGELDTWQLHFVSSGCDQDTGVQILRWRSKMNKLPWRNTLDTLSRSRSWTSFNHVSNELYFSLAKLTSFVRSKSYFGSHGQIAWWELPDQQIPTLATKRKLATASYSYIFINTTRHPVNEFPWPINIFIKTKRHPVNKFLWPSL